MKRLKLEAFKAKNIAIQQQQKVEQLLGQVLGDCHDKSKYDSSGTQGGWMSDLTD